MWQTLGLPKILERLFAGSDLDSCSPTWLLGMFVQKLGLKTASRKKGSSGEQVKYYSLAIPEVILATRVLYVSATAKG